MAVTVAVRVVREFTTETPAGGEVSQRLAKVCSSKCRWALWKAARDAEAATVRHRDVRLLALARELVKLLEES